MEDEENIKMRILEQISKLCKDANKCESGRNDMPLSDARQHEGQQALLAGHTPLLVRKTAGPHPTSPLLISDLLELPGILLRLQLCPQLDDFQL